MKVNVPVRSHLDPRLTEDCAPIELLPASGPLSIDDLVKYVESLEAALSQCRVQLEKIRAVETE